MRLFCLEFYIYLLIKPYMYVYYVDESRDYHL